MNIKDSLNYWVSYSNGTTCKFDSQIRLTGDLHDHIRNVNETSLNIQPQMEISLELLSLSFLTRNQI